MKPRPSREDFEFLFFADDPVSRKRVAPTLARINDARRGASEPRPAADVLARQKTAMEQWWFDPPTGYFDKLSQINQPVLILNGDRDAWFPVASQTLLYDMISDARLAVFPAAGHAAHFQYPKIAAEIVLEFLNMEPKEGLK